MTGIPTAGSATHRLSSASHHLASLLGVVLATALLVGLPLEWKNVGLIVAVGVVQLALAMSWVPAIGGIGYIGSVAVGVTVSVGADVVLGTGTTLGLGSMTGLLAFVVGAAFVHQLLRPAPRERMLESLASVIFLGVILVSLAAYIVVWRTADGRLLVEAAALATGVGLVVSHLLDLVLPMPRFSEGVPRGLLGFLFGVVVAAAIAVWRLGGATLVDNIGAGLYGGVLGAVALLMSVAATYVNLAASRPSLGMAWLQAALPFAATAPVAYFLALVVSA